MRASRMWGVSGEPFTSLGRRGVHGAGVVVVFWVLSMAAVESLAQQPGSNGDRESLLQSEFYGLKCATMGIPRMWAVTRDHRVPLGKRKPHRAVLVVVLLSSSVWYRL